MPDEQVALSVVAAVYNAESTFGDTLRCLFASDIPVPYEVIVVDDASTDGTREVCGAFDVKLVELDANVGPSKARNIAIQESVGEIIMFIDSDVQFGPGLIKNMLERMEQYPEVVGMGSVSVQEPLNPCFYSNYFALQEWEYLSTAIHRDPDGHGLGICTRCGTLRRSIFDEIGGFNEKYTEPSVEDYEFSVRIRPYYRFIWDISFENEHFFPETLGQIFARYHRNTREMVGLMAENEKKDTGVFGNDSRARFFMGMSGLSLMFSIVFLPAIFLALAFFIAGVFTKRNLFSLFLQRKGLVFCFGGIVVYILTSLPIATGLASAYWRRIMAS